MLSCARAEMTSVALDSVRLALAMEGHEGGWMSERISDKDSVLRLTFEIGSTKNQLPARLRGYLNLLGLYVQLTELGGRARLQAGGKHRSYFDAWCDSSPQRFPFPSWDVRKFDAQTWNMRFAHLLGPTFEIAKELRGAWGSSLASNPSPYFRRVAEALQQTERTGLWEGIRRWNCVNCQIVVPYWHHWWQSGRCVQCGEALEMEWLRE